MDFNFIFRTTIFAGIVSAILGLVYLAATREIENNEYTKVKTWMSEQPSLRSQVDTAMSDGMITWYEKQLIEKAYRVLNKEQTLNDIKKNLKDELR